MFEAIKHVLAQSIGSYKRYDDHHHGQTSTQREGLTYLFKGKLIGLPFDNEVQKAKSFKPLSKEKGGCEELVKS